MLEEYQICPYTGLRSFTEEESLYFKGREDHIEQATEQLQRNKFLMLTGASGDGKSSLVYAGIVPNARAGFLKSKYTQWGVADFRPERTPFRNLCRAVAKQLDIVNPQTVESELQHGFSALVDLYKNSKCFVDVDSVAWQKADEAQRAALKRNAANLIIIVDQFEEFFTNPENYHHGVPSRDSNLVLNVLLETSRIALEEDLPIYIVFTMRSDYIGQCAAFRSLPEYIGFSQFFVPRLNRSQLQLVIEEPASLNGNKISRRLAERLIHDVAEGVDQLPILQHALNQIWHAASHGKEEMDLLHYAMVGGMHPSELPDDQVARFTQWFTKLPEKIKRFYQEPNLQNVLDTHANKLYESAAESYRNKTGKEISDETAKDIIKKAFTCLTKIDQSRAVRNRMTLKEIWYILDRADVDVNTVGWVLNIFREPGNTFVRPFITEDPESGILHEDDVLDITHESLIRNWELLEQWAKEEFNNYTISLDFEQQIARWVESGKSGGFLLSIGPLTYFENWYGKVKPNAYWIARYLPEGEKQQQKLSKASIFLSNAREFLKRSTRKHLITRTIVVYGPRRIAAVLAVIGLLILSSFGVTSYMQRQNSYVLKKIKKESILLGGNRKVAVEDKAILLCENVRLGLTTIPEIASGINEPVERINAIASMATAMIIQGWHEPEKEIYESFTVTDSLLEAIPVSLTTANYTDILREINELMVTLDMGYYFNPTERMGWLVKRNAERTAAWVKLIAKEKPMQFTDIKNFDMAIEHAINHHALKPEEINQLLSILSPLESPGTSEWVKTKFARDILSERGWFNYGLAFNGLYQELAYLYASLGNSTKTLMCLDTLMKYNQKYHENDYSHMPDHAAHIAATFYQYNQIAPMDNFVKGYCMRKNIIEVEFYKILVGHNKMNPWATTRLNYWPEWNRFTNPILLLSDENQQTFFINKYRSTIRNLKDADQRNFYLALSYKDQALNKSMMLEHKRIKENEKQINSWFDSAFYYYNKVGKEFVEQKVSMYNDSESRPLKYIFLFPDFSTQNFPSEPRGGYFYFSSTRFIDYILSKGWMDVVYPTEIELSYIEDWLTEYRVILVNSGLGVTSPLDVKALSRLEKGIRLRKTANQNFDDLYLLLGNEIAREKPDSALYFYKQADANRVANLTNKDGNFGMLITALAISNLAKQGEFQEAYRFVQAFKKPVNRSSLYGFAAQKLQRNKVKSIFVNQLIDSARAEMLRVENTGVDQQSRLHLPYALAMRMEGQDLTEADRTIKNVAFKFFVMMTFSRSLAFHGNLFESYENIPPTVSDADRAVFLWNVLYGYSEGQQESSVHWNQYNRDHRWWYSRFIDYDNEDN